MLKKIESKNGHVNKSSNTPLIFLAVGITLLLVGSALVLLMIGHIDDFGFMGGTLLVLLGFGVLFVGFPIFTIGWLSYFKEKKGILPSFGWWMFCVGVWSEVCLLGYWLRSLTCYSDQYDTHWCERENVILPYCAIPVAVVLFGLVLVYLGKKKQKNQISPPV
ncbi:MAG: hypothetical protein WC455_04170 [Dehalococcoidia bacterium]|jgi:hypothetical protein